MSFVGRIRPLATFALMTSVLVSPFAILPASAENRIDTQRPDAPELAAYGDYEVGTRPLYLTNPNQLDVLALDDTDRVRALAAAESLLSWLDRRSGERTDGDG